LKNVSKDKVLINNIKKQLNNLNDQYEKLEFSFLFFEKYDNNDAVLAIHAGAGGSDAHDFTEILLRMYTRFCENKDFKVKVVYKSLGMEAGIKTVELLIKGYYAYGYLKSEAGVHRLVRISPFDAEKMRHTSFALVEVIPDFGQELEIEINPKDIRIDTFCSSGHGGQSVNTTYSGVRIVHLPTSVTAISQNERSQFQNKEIALKILKFRLKQKEIEKRRAKESGMKGVYKEAKWGNQIRSYILHPYTLVKDHRFKFEITDVNKVLDGDLEPLIINYLKWRKAMNNN
jgi:peptide chain release factor 2